MPTLYTNGRCVPDALIFGGSRQYTGRGRILWSEKKEVIWYLLVVFQAENIKFDPEMYGKCTADVVKFCNNVTPGSAKVSVHFIVLLKVCLLLVLSQVY